MTLSLLPVQEVKTLGLEELVDLCTSDTGEHLLGELVLGVFALGFLKLLVLAHGDKTGTETDGFVGELGLVLAGVLVVCWKEAEAGIQR